MKIRELLHKYGFLTVIAIFTLKPAQFSERNERLKT